MSKDRRNDQGLGLIPKREGKYERIPFDSIRNVRANGRRSVFVELICDGRDEVIRVVSARGCSKEEEAGEKKLLVIKHFSNRS